MPVQYTQLAQSVTDRQTWQVAQVYAYVQVLVSMSKELPVVVKYQMGDIGHIRCDTHPLQLHRLP